CIGPITKSIEDAALLLEVMAGADENDSTVSRKEVPTYSADLVWEGKARIGYIRETIENDALSLEIRERTTAVLNSLRAAGHDVAPVEMPLLGALLPTYYI